MIEYVSSVKSYAELPKGAEVLSVNGIGVVDKCLFCEKYVLDTHLCVYLGDGVYVHEKCNNKKK